MDSSPVQIFRYELSTTMKQEIIRFSDINKFTDRESFNKNWDIWVIDNQILIQNEIKELQCKKYNGDIIKKMYTSARYYYRNKKPISTDLSKRKKYISISKELLNLMDNNINQSMKLNDYKPEKSFENFCINQDNHAILKKAISEIKQKEENISLEDIKKKIKKTYKNRYRLIIT